MKWSTEYPKSEGWYWIAPPENFTYSSIEYFHYNEDVDQTYTTDSDYNRYGRDYYKGFLFSGPLKEPQL